MMIPRNHDFENFKLDQKQKMKVYLQIVLVIYLCRTQGYLVVFCTLPI